MKQIETTIKERTLSTTVNLARLFFYMYNNTPNAMISSELHQRKKHFINMQFNISLGGYIYMQDRLSTVKYVGC